jgi:hypothetical protein
VIDATEQQEPDMMWSFVMAESALGRSQGYAPKNAQVVDASGKFSSPV